MEQWHQTIVGIIVLGAFGSLVATFLIWLVKRYWEGMTKYLAVSIAKWLLLDYAKNVHFIRECEERGRMELIIIRCLNAQARYDAYRYRFIFVTQLNIIVWFLYFQLPLPIAAPILVLLLNIYTFVRLLGHLFGVMGVYPKEMLEIHEMLHDKSKEDIIGFIDSSGIGEIKKET